MATIILQLILLLFVVGIIYGCLNLTKTSPDIISGFKMSKDPEQKKIDEMWLRRLSDYMRRANIVTLIGGLIGIVSGVRVVYLLSLILPMCVGLLLAYTGKRR